MNSLLERYFKGVVFKRFYKIELNASELNIAQDSLKNKYAKGALESGWYGLLSLPALLFVDTSILSSVLIPVAMVSGTAWFAISLVNIKKKFEAFGSELTVDMYRSFVTSLVLLSLMTLVSLNSRLVGGISAFGKQNALVVLLSGLLGTVVVVKMIYDIFSGATKYDMNDSMLTGQNEAAEKYYKKSLSLLSSCANRLKQGAQGDVAGYFLGLAFFEIFSFIIAVKGFHEKFQVSLKQAEALKAAPPKQKLEMLKTCIPFVENFLSYVTNLQDSQTAKSYRNIQLELKSLKKKTSESQEVINIRLATILEEMEDMLAGQGEALFKKRLEIEKKFLVKQLPRNLDQYQHEDIEQGYLETGGQTETRIRKQGEIYFRTVKERIGADRRQETEEYISREEFEKLWPKTKDRRVEKTRYHIPFKEFVIELDVFKGANQNLVLAEVEFESDSQILNFKPPSWFQQEVTEDSQYKNVNLAK